jgi:UDP-N-acetylmuramate: L-alanyl-gamma-D-glutamyl-meso-diaminopimelate ligase
MNMNGARIVCNQAGISDAVFYEAMTSFKGAAKRLELVKEEKNFAMFKDFAHSPSKLKATIEATKKQFTGRKLLACMELHTFSSLNENFLNEYKGAMDMADEAIVYFNPHTIEHKKLKAITEGQVRSAFARNDIKIFTESDKVKEYLKSENRNNTTVLMMSSGNFDGVDFAALANELLVI